jgi:hypothetical protein
MNNKVTVLFFLALLGPGIFTGTPLPVLAHEGGRYS